MTARALMVSLALLVGATVAGVRWLALAAVILVGLFWVTVIGEGLTK